MNVNVTAVFFIVIGLYAVLWRGSQARRYVRVHGLLWPGKAAPVDPRRAQLLPLLVGIAFIALGVFGLFAG